MQLEGLRGRGVLVTGAGSSVGRLIAECFANEGARVHIADVSEAFVADCSSGSSSISGSVCNLGDSIQVHQLTRDAETALGQIDFLVNCVGVAGPRGLVEELDSGAWRETFDVNVHGIFETMQSVIPGMKQRGFGAIINFSSASTRTGLPSRSAYVAGKAALESLSHTAARELGPFNVRCNCILPGAINNERMNSVLRKVADDAGISLAQAEQRALEFISMRTKIEPQELADMTLFLCSDSGRHISGQMIEVSGNLEWEG